MRSTRTIKDEEASANTPPPSRSTYGPLKRAKTPASTRPNVGRDRISPLIITLHLPG